MKHLMPSLRQKKRYLVYDVVSEELLDKKTVENEILNAAVELNGRLVLGKAGLVFLDDWNKNTGILKVNNKYVDNIKASLCFIRKVNKKEAIIKSKGISGILKKARNKFMAM